MKGITTWVIPNDGKKKNSTNRLRTGERDTASSAVPISTVKQSMIFQAVAANVTRKGNRSTFGALQSPATNQISCTELSFQFF